MKRFLIFIIIVLGTLGIGAVSAAPFYEWSGSLNVGESVHVNSLALMVDQDNITHELALIVQDGDQLLGLLKANDSGKFQGLSIEFKEFNGYGIVSIESEKPFAVAFNVSEDYQKQVEALLEENTQLKAKVQSLSSENEKLKKEVQNLQAENAKLKKRLESQPNTAELQAKLVNLTKENRELKAELANMTNKYNAIKAKEEFLEQQNNEYRTMIQKLLKDASSKSEQNYIEKAKKEKLVGSVLVKTIIFSGIVVGLIGLVLYRGKRGWEYAKL